MIALMVPYKFAGDVVLKWTVNAYDEEGDLVKELGYVTSTKTGFQYNETLTGLVLNFFSAEEASQYFLNSFVLIHPEKLN